MLWLLDDFAYDNVYGDYEIHLDKLRKCIALSECIVSISKKSFTPFHLGLYLEEADTRIILQALFADTQFGIDGD